MKFDDFAFEPAVKDGLRELAFLRPTPIQQISIPLILNGTDLMGCAETGSGKTGAFAIPFFSKLIQEPKARLLVLTPTRELAQQVAEFFRELSKFDESMTVTTIVGGADIRKQLKGLKRTPRIVVGTPGRITDHLKRGSLKLDTTQFLVLDEGDRMLDMGFAPQLDVILNYLPKQRQTCLYTATLPPKVKALASKYLNQPEYLQIGKVSKPVENIHQQVIEIDEKMKNDLILDELNNRRGSIVIFLKTKHRTTNLFKFLNGYGYKVDLIHGGRSQAQRNTALKKFRAGESRILCATDVAARGLDIPSVEHVINFDLPVMTEDYLHRIGRTARNGAKGEAVSFVAPQERREWMNLVKQFNIIGADLKIPKKTAKRQRGSSGPKRAYADQEKFRAKGRRKSPPQKTDWDRPKKNSRGTETSWGRPKKSSEKNEASSWDRPKKKSLKAQLPWHNKMKKSVSPSKLEFSNDREEQNSFNEDNKRQRTFKKKTRATNKKRLRFNTKKTSSDETKPLQKKKSNNKGWKSGKSQKKFSQPRSQRTKQRNFQ